MKDRKPNLQNIPLRTEEGKRLRDAFLGDFTPRGVDFSDVEFRLFLQVTEPINAAFDRFNALCQWIASETRLWSDEIPRWENEGGRC